MNFEEIQEAARYIRNSSVNVQFDWALDYNGDLLLCLRATPWRNSFNPNRMILIGTYDLNIGLTVLAAELEASRWLRLDWKARPSEAGVYEPEVSVRADLLERTRQLRTRAAEIERDGYKHTGDADPVA